jgi:hypothetical protein
MPYALLLPSEDMQLAMEIPMPNVEVATWLVTL